MKGEIEFGRYNTPFTRDHNDTFFQDQVSFHYKFFGCDLTVKMNQISKPREGPNPRLLSNLLFNKASLYKFFNQ